VSRRLSMYVDQERWIKESAMICPYCGNEMDYVGVADGGGNDGSAVCDEYQCPACDWVDEANCIEYEESQTFEGDMWPLEID